VRRLKGRAADVGGTGVDDEEPLVAEGADKAVGGCRVGRWGPGKAGSRAAFGARMPMLGA